MTDLHYLSATEVLSAFRARELSPVEVLEAVQARADVTEPTVNCLLERDHDDLREAAHAAEERYSGKGEAPRPLEGLPVALKELHSIAGRSLSYGSMLTKSMVADKTHPVAERVLDAGALVHARTTTPEFTCALFSHSDQWGITRNPWNLDYSAGGSSGGSAAALAAGTAYLATGSDIAGSIRIPASFCGIVGFKAPYGRVPAAPPINLDVYCLNGAMGRTVADTALLHNAIQGQHPVDHTSLPAEPIPSDLGHVRGMRIAFAVTLGDFLVDPEVELNTKAFAEALRLAGAEVEEVKVDISVKRLTEAALVHLGAVMGPAIEALGASGPQDPRLMSYTRQFLKLTSEAFQRTGTYHGMELESEVHLELAHVFADHDALICPTFGGLGLRAADDYAAGIDVAGDHLDFYLFAGLTPVFNVASRYPVLAVPSGISSIGVPTGVQVIAKPYDDVTAFHVGAAAERELGLWSIPTWRPSL